MMRSISKAKDETLGPLSGLTFGNSVAAALTYDQDYELTGIAAAKGAAHIQSLTNGYDPAGNITAITDALASSRSQTLGYDNLNRLNAASGVYGSQSYTYDGVGNRLTRVIGSTTDTYAYSSTANQISTVTTGSNVRSFSYLASGQVSQDVRDPSHTYTFAANDNGRNASAALNASTVGSYLYNAFEQRVQKVASSTTTQQVYDRFGHLLMEANASGVVQKEYIWLDTLPVAMVDDTGASPVLYFIHTDQLGTPQKITDASANVVWDSVSDPFGNAVTISSLWGSPTQWGNNFTWEPTTPEPINLRFPGQYFDAETALNQNWNRDYDPTTGRYIQSDAIGLLGGVNTYVYAGSNTLVEIDPVGAHAVPIPVPFPFPVPPVAIPGTPENNEWTQFATQQLNRLLRFCFGEGVDCGEQLKKCRNMCLDTFVQDPELLPGTGRDYQGRMRRCIRECMEANGCKNF